MKLTVEDILELSEEEYIMTFKKSDLEIGND